MSAVHNGHWSIFRIWHSQFVVDAKRVVDRGSKILRTDSGIDRISGIFVGSTVDAATWNTSTSDDR